MEDKNFIITIIIISVISCFLMGCIAITDATNTPATTTVESNHTYTVIHCPNPDCPNHDHEPYHAYEGGWASYKISTLGFGYVYRNSDAYCPVEILCEYCGAIWQQDIPV